MYVKLALQNVRKSWEDYRIYFLTLCLAVSLFYCFNASGSRRLFASIPDLPANMSAVLEALSEQIQELSFFIALLLGVLIVYANQFILQRRTKEFGVYHTLGMRRRDLSLLLLLEMLFVGLLSLAAGVTLGILLSQFICTFTASMFIAHVEYHFVFSLHALAMTLLAFGSIFSIAVLCNTLLLLYRSSRRLLYPDNGSRRFVIRSFPLSLAMLAAALLALVSAVSLLHDASWDDTLSLVSALSLSLLGTLLFFAALSALLQVFTRYSRFLCYRSLNGFILRQLSSRFSSGFLSSSLICVMLTLGITALAAGFSISMTINAQIDSLTPYSFSLIHPYQESDPSTPALFEQEIRKLSLSPENMQAQRYYHTYTSEFDYDRLQRLAITQDVDLPWEVAALDSAIEVVPLSAFNQARRDQGLTDVRLNASQVLFCSNYAGALEALEELTAKRLSIYVYDHALKVVPKLYHDSSIANADGFIAQDALFIVVPDATIPLGAASYADYWNVQLQPSVSTQEFARAVRVQLQNRPLFQSDAIALYLADHDQIQIESVGSSIIYAYIGLYAGITMLLVACVLLALRALSQTQLNRRDYHIFHKLGASALMQRQALFWQTLLHFLLPLPLTLFHSVILMQIIHRFAYQFGRYDTSPAAFYTVLIFLGVHLSYFTLTWLRCRRIALE